MRRRRTQSRLSSKASGHKKGSNNAGARIAFPVGLLRRLSQAFASPVRKGCSPSSGSDSAHFLETSRVQEGASQPRPCLLHLRPLNFASRQHRRGVTESASSSVVVSGPTSDLHTGLSLGTHSRTPSASPPVTTPLKDGQPEESRCRPLIVWLRRRGALRTPGPSHTAESHNLCVTKAMRTLSEIISTEMRGEFAFAPS